jgi:hypothetical protein
MSGCCHYTADKFALVVSNFLQNNAHLATVQKQALPVSWTSMQGGMRDFPGITRSAGRSTFYMDVIVNRQVWMQCFGAGIPNATRLQRSIKRLESRLTALGTPRTRREQQACSRIWNSLQRHHKMLAAVHDGQPWAWHQYPAPGQIATRH